jgi:metal-dependent amidase/aminoacylase/carboxypeptidase family protein
MPHKTHDAVVAAAMAVVALQPLVSREVNPVQGGVVTVSRINTGRQGVCVICAVVCVSADNAGVNVSRV